MKLQSTTQPDGSAHIVLTLGQHNALRATIDTCSEAIYTLRPGAKKGTPTETLEQAFRKAVEALREINDAINEPDEDCITAVYPKPKPEDSEDE